MFKKEMVKNPADLTKAITDVFEKMDKELRLLDADGCGSTACVEWNETAACQ